MARGRLQELLEELNSQIAKSEKLDVPKENLERLVAFRDKIKKELDEPVPDALIPTCFVTVKYENLDEPSGFYYVDTPVFVAGVRLVTADSTLGKIINGRKKGDKLSFKTTNEYGEVDVNLEILTIE